MIKPVVRGNNLLPSFGYSSVPCFRLNRFQRENAITIKHPHVDLCEIKVDKYLIDSFDAAWYRRCQDVNAEVYRYWRFAFFCFNGLIYFITFANELDDYLQFSIFIHCFFISRFNTFSPWHFLFAMTFEMLILMNLSKHPMIFNCTLHKLKLTM